MEFKKKKDKISMKKLYFIKINIFSISKQRENTSIDKINLK